MNSITFPSELAPVVDCGAPASSTRQRLLILAGSFLMYCMCLGSHASLLLRRRPPLESARAPREYGRAFLDPRLELVTAAYAVPGARAYEARHHVGPAVYLPADAPVRCASGPYCNSFDKRLLRVVHVPRQKCPASHGSSAASMRVACGRVRQFPLPMPYAVRVRLARTLCAPERLRMPCTRPT